MWRGRISLGGGQSVPAGLKTLLLGLLTLLSTGWVMDAAVGQEQQPAQQGPFREYLAIVGQEYIPPAKSPKKGQQLLRLTLDLSPDLPTGTKLRLALQYTGLNMTEMDITVRQQRKGVVVDWHPYKKVVVGKRTKLTPMILGPDKYTLFSMIPISEQTPAVQRGFAAKAKRFPPEIGSWPRTYDAAKDRILIGTPEELAALEEKICAIYDEFCNALVENMVEFEKSMKAVKDGEKFADGGGVDIEKLTDYIKKWQLKQAAVQRRIREMPLDQPTPYNKSLTAHAHLIQLGQMVSKRANKVQKEVETKIGERIKFENLKEKEASVLNYFDYRYRYKSEKTHLNDKLDKILVLTCPEEEEEGEEEAAEG